MSSAKWLVRGLPRIAILITAIAEILDGDVLYGTFCLVAFAITLIPAILTRRLDADLPLELELVLLWLMVADMTLGNWLGLYQLRWYDKVLHVSSSALVTWIGFLAIYVLHLTHRARFRPWLDGVAILFVTLGVGALWEIAEYGVDQVFGRRTQGAPDLSALDDTMFDLMLDGLGGLIGAILGPLYLRYSRRSRDLVEAFATFVHAPVDSSRAPRRLRPSRTPPGGVEHDRGPHRDSARPLLHDGPCALSSYPSSLSSPRAWNPRSSTRRRRRPRISSR